MKSKSKIIDDLYDVFICHASEDKKQIVRPIATLLARNHVEVWYDESALKPGDSLRESIEKGLSKSRFGIVVFSKNFFKKQWPQKELNGLFNKLIDDESRKIIPIWHKITKKELLKHAPIAADIFAIDSSLGNAKIVKEILKIIKPQGSPLIEARDIIIKYGIKPPVITDEWWLDVVRAVSREPNSGFGPVNEHWDNWSFPIPSNWDNTEEKGVSLAWTAMQYKWTEKASELKLSQLTHPEKILEFIESERGLKEMCEKWPLYLAIYAPQITIKGFGGCFEATFDEIMTNPEYERMRDDLPFRNPKSKISKASMFTMGPDAMSGPVTAVYDFIDYIVWLLSSDSLWMPKYIKNEIVNGFKTWNVWNWGYAPKVNFIEYDESNWIDYPENGKFLEQICNKNAKNECALNAESLADIKKRFEFTKKILNLADNVDELVQSFLNSGLIESYLKNHNKSK